MFFFLIWIRCCLGFLEDGENAFEVGFVVVGIVSCIFNSLRLALRDVKLFIVWKRRIYGRRMEAERCFIKISHLSEVASVSW